MTRIWKSAEIKVDQAQWSEPSKRSYAYVARAPHYADVVYRCLKCSANSVFTAAEQKHAFEVKKRYIWQRRILCIACHAALQQLKAREQALRQRWSKTSASLTHDATFLHEWLAALNELPSYGKRRNTSMSRRLDKLLTALAPALPEQKPSS